MAFALFKQILQAQKKYGPLGRAVREKIGVVCPIGMRETNKGLITI